MSDTQNINNEFWKRFVVVVVMVFAVVTLTNAVSSYISYPTQSHRAVAKELAALQTRSFAEAEANPLQDERQAQLVKSEEAQYTSLASMGTTIMSFVVFLYLTWKIYAYSRKKKFTGRYKLFTIDTIVIGSVLAAAAGFPITNAIVGFDATSEVSLVGTLMFTAVTTLIVTAIVVMVIESRYGKRRSLIVE